ncbi:MAG: VCBS repeat-containing protein [Candidatus Latescibacterota bacterium]
MQRIFLLGTTALGVCAPTAAQAYFADVTDSVFAQRESIGRAVAWGDQESDGWSDLLLVSSGDPPARALLWTNEGGVRSGDGSAAVGAEAGRGIKGGGAVWGDCDKDGDLDAYVAVGAYVRAYRGQPVLLRNDRGAFTNVSRQVGLTDTLAADNALWLDYDRDGHLDPYTGNMGLGNDADADPRNDSDPTVRSRLYLGSALPPLHTEMGVSSTSSPAALSASRPLNSRASKSVTLRVSSSWQATAPPRGAPELPRTGCLPGCADRGPRG